MYVVVTCSLPRYQYPDPVPGPIGPIRRDKCSSVDVLALIGSCRNAEGFCPLNKYPQKLKQNEVCQSELTIRSCQTLPRSCRVVFFYLYYSPGVVGGIGIHGEYVALE